ncbi:MAG: DUF4065 domain-containing protein [bacterium]|nr:DUF4065 domain-containing protein [bacterium]
MHRLGGDTAVKKVLLILIMTSQKSLPIAEIVEYFLWKAKSLGKPLTNKKLQKLLYYAQAWSLVLRKQKLFEDKIEAWVHGPAVRSVYLKYKRFGFAPIKKEVDQSTLKKIPATVVGFLDQVWKVYGKYDAGYLEYLTHSEEPWQKAREGIEAHVGSENEIPLQLMHDYYSSKLKASREK